MLSTFESNGPGGSGSGTNYTINVGIYSPDSYSYVYGFLTGNAGSISPTNFTNSGTAINGLYYESYNYITFVIVGVYPQNKFTQLFVNGTLYSSASASYSATGTTTIWTWYGVTSNPFPSVGSNVQVTII